MQETTLRLAAGIGTTDGHDELKLCLAMPNRPTPSETFIHNQVRELMPRLTLYSGWLPHRILPAGYLFSGWMRVELLRGLYRKLAPRDYQRSFDSAFVSLLRSQQIQVVLAEYGIMGVHLHLACKAAGVPLVVHFHGYDAAQHNILARYATAYKVLFQAAHTVVVVSEDMRQALLSLDAPAEKLILNPYGVALGQFYGGQPATSAPLLVAVGRFTAKKAPAHTLRAFAQALRSVPALRLVMIGGGEELASCQKLATELGIADSVQFLGVQPPAVIADWLRRARAFVQHSLTAPNGDAEGTPNTILEASATGLSIISTRHAGIKEAVVHGETGFLVEEHDIVGMSAYMVQLATDAPLAAKMGAAARAHMEQNYSMPMRMERLKDILRAAATDSKVN